MVIAAGIDGYRKGWVAIVLEDGHYQAAFARPSLEALIDALSGATAIGIDIPIGLPDRGRRPADEEARRFVGPRRNSVFFTVPRAVWETADDAEARAISLELEGISVPTQTLALRTKVLEADALAQSNERLCEVHPEVSFAAMAGGYLEDPKSTWAGAVARMRLLEEASIVLPAELGDAGAAGMDDVLDAAAVAWSATRVARGDAVSLPARPVRGPDGLVAAIWY